MSFVHDFRKPGQSAHSTWKRYHSVDNVKGIDHNPAPDRISLKQTKQGRETLIDVVLTKGEGAYSYGFKELTRDPDNLVTLSAYSYNGSACSGYQIDESPFGISGVSFLPGGSYTKPSYEPLSLGESLALFSLAQKEMNLDGQGLHS